MRASLSFVTAALVLLSSSGVVQAGLQNPSAEALQALADLSRSPPDKHLPDGYVPQAATYNAGVSKSNGGVAWSVDPQPQMPNTNNTAKFEIKPASAQSAQPATAAAAGQRTTASGTKDGGMRLSAQAGSVNASTFYPTNPPNFPLAVRGPYLSAWLPSGSDRSATPPNIQGNGGYLAGQYPAFWTTSYGADGEFRLGWSGFIRINGKSYQWMGDSFGTLVQQGPNAVQLSAEYTATRTIFAFQADSVKFNVTFMTPITPNDYLRQSLPLSYLHFELDTTTTKKKDIQIYTEIDERWVTGHDYDFQNYPYNMQFQVVNSTSMYLVQRNNPEVYTEFRQRAEWGSSVYAVKNVAGLSSRNNNNVVTQLEFLTKGNLTFDHGGVGGPDNSFAYAVNFSAPNAPSDVVFAVGHLRNPYVNYVRAVPGVPGKSYQEDRYGYWQAQFPNFNDAVAFFLNDFDDALVHAKALDSQIVADAKKAAGGGIVGDHYAAIAQLAVRQALGAIEITISRDGTGAYNASDALIFLKEISSNGDMSTVDVIFPLFPLLAYLNVELLRDLLEPLYVYAETLYPNKVRFIASCSRTPVLTFFCIALP